MAAQVPAARPARRRSFFLAAPSTRGIAWIKGALFALALLPFARLVLGVPLGWLGFNPVELIQRSTGTWTLVFLLITLSVTPLRKLGRWYWLARLRRMFGLYAFFYGALHFTTYVWLDHWFDPMKIAMDIVKRPFITIGFCAFVMMIPLAITSTDAMVRRLGAANWISLHRFVYVLAVAAVIHYWWLVKRDLTQPILYALVLALLLGSRLVFAVKKTRPNSLPESSTVRS